MNNCQVLSKPIQIYRYRYILNNLISHMHSQHNEKVDNFEDDVLLPFTSDGIYMGVFQKKFTVVLYCVHKYSVDIWAGYINFDLESLSVQNNVQEP